jgi:hypothetical protein
VRVEHPARPEQRVVFARDGRPLDADGVRVGIDQIAVFCIPFEALGVAVERPVQFFVELLERGQSRDRAPRDAAVTVLRPSPDFERIMWDV